MQHAQGEKKCKPHLKALSEKCKRGQNSVDLCENEDNIKMGLSDVGIKSVDWFCGIAIRAVVNTAVSSEKEGDSTDKQMPLCEVRGNGGGKVLPKGWYPCTEAHSVTSPKSAV
jgi:hypothetical protein